MIDILGNTTCFSSVNYVHEIEFEIKFESRFNMKRAKKATETKYKTNFIFNIQ